MPNILLVFSIETGYSFRMGNQTVTTGENTEGDATI